jgi:hypothetical protein
MAQYVTAMTAMTSSCDREHCQGMLLDCIGDRSSRSSPETPAHNVLWPQKAADGLQKLADIDGVAQVALASCFFVFVSVPHKAKRRRLRLAFSAGVRMNNTLSSVKSGDQLPDPVRPFLG